MNRVLVTGAAGFIGFPCLQILCEQGFEVHTVSSTTMPAQDERIFSHVCNLLDASAVEILCEKVKATHLLHLAWQVDLNSEDNIRWIQASMNLIKVFHKYGGSRITVAGTCFEYDFSSVPLYEMQSPKGPHTVYGASKHTLHELVRSYARLTNLSYAWARVFYLYGPRENPRRLVASIANALLNNQRAACTDGRQIRDYLHVQDAANALVNILNSDINGAINVASGVPVSVREVAYTTADLLSASQYLDFGAKKITEQEPLVIVANIDKLRNAFDWKPNYDLATGLSDTIEWWRKKLKDQEETRQ